MLNLESYTPSIVVVRAIVASAVLGLLLLAIMRGAAWVSEQTVDHNTVAEGVAVTYVRAILTLDYSTWWDSVSPACRTTSDTKDKVLWMAEARRYDVQAGRTPAPSNVVVSAQGSTGTGTILTVHVRAKNSWTSLSDYLDVSVRQVDGRWGVTNRASQGTSPARDCDVWSG
jgi:hypothetical protein